MTLLFPDAFYPPVSSDYKDRLKKGVDVASKHRVYICGICRDCEIYLEDNLYRIEQLKKFFATSRVFIYENDSKDNTKKILDNWVKYQYNTVFLSEKLDTDHKQDKSLRRRINMANARNTYLEHEVPADIMIVLDLDLYGFSIEGILHSLSYYTPKTIIGSNSIVYQDGVRLFYDSWALRYLNSWDDLGDTPNTLILNRGEKIIEVNSCFGGCAIYPYDVTKHARYEYYDCDHVTFHKTLKKYDYKVYLNPSQITLYSESYYNK
jgi:hypothetical protein